MLEEGLLPFVVCQDLSVKGVFSSNKLPCFTNTHRQHFKSSFHHCLFHITPMSTVPNVVFNPANSHDCERVFRRLSLLSRQDRERTLNSLSSEIKDALLLHVIDNVRGVSRGKSNVTTLKSWELTM